ncbi:MAG: hypothetical protein QM755_19975 [Luteolibacter sp.]
MNRPIITLTKISANFARYVDWLAAGLGEMQLLGEAEFRCDLQPVNRLLGINGPRWLIRRLMPRVFHEVDGGPVFEGTVQVADKVVRFCYDVDDRPFWFDLNALQDTDIYFKAQMPRDFPGPFHLSSELAYPLPASVIECADRVRPAMLGRPLARSLKPAPNKAVLDAWSRHGEIEPDGSLFAYFGGISNEMTKPMTMECGRVGSRPPRFRVTGAPASSDYPSSGPAGHPNQKRLDLVRLLRGWNDPRIDARMVSAPDASVVGPEISDPLEYARRLARFDWNCNITGLYGSMPFRFADAFAMGRGVITDDLVVRWYEPFDADCEVRELGPMGYEPAEKVDWQRATAVLKKAAEDSDPASSRERRAHIRSRYERLWNPLAFARYLTRECVNSL